MPLLYTGFRIKILSIVDIDTKTVEIYNTNMSCLVVRFNNSKYRYIIL